MLACARKAPLMINVIKQYPRADGEEFDLFGRVLSGAVKVDLQGGREGLKGEALYSVSFLFLILCLRPLLCVPPSLFPSTPLPPPLPSSRELWIRVCVMDVLSL